MIITKIASDRHYQNKASWQIVYEWEDEISNSLDIPIKDSPNPNKVIPRKLRVLENKLFKGNLIKFKNKVFFNKDKFLYFEMFPKRYTSFSNSQKYIPIILDFFEREKLDLIMDNYAQCDFLLITNLEVFNLLKEHNIRKEIIHFPLSIPSIYRLNENDNFAKKFDLVLVGRQNPILLNFLREYEKANPTIKYFYRVKKNGQFYYQSNQKDIVRKVSSRQEYINLIREAKVAFYSTPGIDGGEQRTNGFNPVTPRFFELLAAGCHIIARYPKNADTDFFSLESICSSASSYNNFAKQLNTTLASSPPIKRNAKYLQAHYMSKRVKILKELI